MTNRDLKRLEDLAPTDEELRDAAEEADAGLRLAFPHLFEQHQGEPCEKHVLDHETASTVGRELLNARQSIFNAAKALPLKPQIDIHLRLNCVLNEIDEMAGMVAERWGEE